MLQWVKKLEKKIYLSFFEPKEFYNFSSEKLDSLLRIFYCVSLGLIIHGFSHRVTVPFWLKSEYIYWSWSVKWMMFLKFEEKVFIIWTTFFLTVFLCVLCLFFIRSIRIKVLCAACFFILSSIEFSSGRAGHYLNYWAMAFIIFSFIGKDREKDRFLFHTAQFSLLMTYGLSGIHKLTALIHYVTRFGIENLKPVEKSIAIRLYDFPYYTLGKSILLEVSSWPSFILLFLWGLLIYFQISCFFIAFRPPLFRLWGVFIILFHLITVFTLQVMFFYNMILVSLLFVETPYDMTFSIKKAIIHIPGVRIFLNLITWCYTLLKKSGRASI